MGVLIMDTTEAQADACTSARVHALTRDGYWTEDTKEGWDLPVSGSRRSAAYRLKNALGQMTIFRGNLTWRKSFY